MRPSLTFHVPTSFYNCTACARGLALRWAAVHSQQDLCSCTVLVTTHGWHHGHVTISYSDAQCYSSSIGSSFNLLVSRPSVIIILILYVWQLFLHFISYCIILPTSCSPASSRCIWQLLLSCAWHRRASSLQVHRCRPHMKCQRDRHMQYTMSVPQGLRVCKTEVPA